MGDAFLAVIDDVDALFKASVGIANGLNKHCEYISHVQSENPSAWEACPGGASLKIAIEYGWLDISTIHSSFLGEQRLIGPAINYAARISAGGVGNRCLLGPTAAKMVSDVFQGVHGPYEVRGKTGESDYTYYELDLSDLWLEGKREPGEESYWG